MTNIKAMGKITLEELESDIAWLNSEKAGCCHHVVAHTDAGTVLAIVVGWSDGFEAAPAGTPNADGTWRVCAKIAYQHSNNAMQCDFDIDWYMPYNLDTGEVDDTCTEITATQANVDWLNDTAKRVWKDWRTKLDKMG